MIWTPKQKRIERPRMAECSGLGLGLGFGGGGAASSFQPADIAGLRADYDGDDPAIVIATGASSWPNKVAGDANTTLVQATGAKQPTKNATDAAYNNHTTFSFVRASSQGMVSTGAWAVSVALPETVFVVGQFSGTAINEYMLDGGALNQRVVSTVNPGTTRAGIYNGAFLSSGLALSAAPQIIAGQFNGATSKVWSSALTAAVSGTSGTTAANRTGLSIGIGGDGATAPMSGKIARILIYNSVLSAPNFALVMGYLGTRYGISVGA